MTRRISTRLLVVVALVAALGLLWVVRVVTPWVDRSAAFATFIVILGLLVMLIDALIALVGPGLWRFTRSVSLSVGGALCDDAQVQSLIARYPRLFGWLGRRFSVERPTGLYLTVTAGLGIYFFAGFVSIARSLALSSAITRYDPQIQALARAFRTPAVTGTFWLATPLSDARVIVFLTVGVVVLLALWGRRSQAVFLGLTMLGGALVQTTAQVLVHRARPPVAVALINQPASFSFPSGPAFATLLLLGALLFVLWRVLPTLAARLAASWAFAFVVLFVGVSRVYLGVHWMSDIIASWSLALSWLIVGCGYYLYRVRFRTLAQSHPPLWTHRVRTAVTVGVIALVMVAVVMGARLDPLLARATAGPETTRWRVSVDASGALAPTSAQMQQLPLFSEKLDGTHQEPISIVFVGTSAQLTSAFRVAGWQLADNPTPVTLLRASLAAISNRSYPTAPVTPSFLGGSVQDVAFEKSAGTATVRRRHHVRFWQTSKTVGRAPVWVATASFDSRLEIGSAIPLPTHHIEPNIDAEQAYIVQDLVRGGGAVLVARVRAVQPLSGTNAQGDQWFTQGFASVLQGTHR